MAVALDTLLRFLALNRQLSYKGLFILGPFVLVTLTTHFVTTHGIAPVLCVVWCDAMHCEWYFNAVNSTVQHKNAL